MIIDLEKRDTTTLFPTGLTGFISYTRLVEQLRKAGEFKPHETITHLKMDNDGMSYIVKTLAGAAIGLCLTLSSPADAACACACINSKLIKVCTDPLDVSTCAGACLGDKCVGLCTLHPNINEQARIDAEAKENAWKARKPPPQLIQEPKKPRLEPSHPVLRYEQRI